MRSFLAAFACVCACNALSLRTLSPVADEQKYILPTIADLDGTGKDITSQSTPSESYKPKYTEFSAAESDSGAEMHDGKTYKPTYKKVIEEMEKPSVTKGFCAGVLKAIEAKEAPYFIDGESSGEMRVDLIQQCGTTICEWGAAYRKTMAEFACPKCPNSCEEGFDAKEFFNALMGDDAEASPIIKAILKLSGDTEGSDVTLEVKEQPAEDEEETEEIDLGALGGTIGNGGDSDVTRGFCVKVLNGVKNKEAPYYVDGVFTGEKRKELIGQCGEMVCEWSNTYKALLKKNEPCPMAGSQEDKDKYVISIMKDGASMGELVLHASAEK